jgi:hypothetical protein
MRNTIFVALAAALAFRLMTYSVWAASVGGGVGVRTCAEFAKDYQGNPSNEIIYVNWALGMLTGMNAVNEVSGNPRRDLAAISFEAKKEFMREYCDQHPLQLYMQGVAAMGLSLPLMPGDRPR